MKNIEKPSKKVYAVIALLFIFSNCNTSKVSEKMTTISCNKIARIDFALEEIIRKSKEDYLGTFNFEPKVIAVSYSNSENKKTIYIDVYENYCCTDDKTEFEEFWKDKLEYEAFYLSDKTLILFKKTFYKNPLIKISKQKGKVPFYFDISVNNITYNYEIDINNNQRLIYRSEW